MEEQILGRIILDFSLLDYASLKLVEEDFLSFETRNLFKLLLQFKEDRYKEFNISVAATNYPKAFADCGGAEKIAEILENVNQASDFKLEVGSLIERNVINQRKNILKNAYKILETDPKNSEAYLKEEWNKTSTRLKKFDRKSIFTEMRERTLLKEKPSVIHFDIPQLNKYIGNVFRGKQLTIAARANLGKTTFATALCTDYAMKNPKGKVLMFSLEITRDALYNKVLAYATNVDSRDILTDTLLDEERDFIDKNNKEFEANNNLKIYDMSDCNSSVNLIESIIQEEYKEGPIDVVFLDYIQLLSQSADYYNELRIISQSLHAMAQKYKFVLVALSQLNRSTEGREDKRPMLSDLRGSGSLEQDADIVFALYDEHYYEHEDNMPVVRDIDIAVVKNRDGPKGTAKVTMDFRTGRMMNDETN